MWGSKPRRYATCNAKRWVRGNMTTKPKCIIVTGRPGSGKTTLSRKLGEKLWMPKLVELSSPYLVICSIDGEVAANRHLQRRLAEPRREFYHGDKRVSNYRATGEVAPPDRYIPPDFEVPTLLVSTDGEYSPSIDAIVYQIQPEYAQSGPRA